MLAHLSPDAERFSSPSRLSSPPSRCPRSRWSPRRAIPRRRRTRISRNRSRSGRRSRTSSVRWSITCRRSRASRSPKDVLGYHIGAPAKLTYYADILKYYRALAAATPRVKIETIGKSDEDRELVVVWVSSDDNIKNLQTEPRQPGEDRRPARAAPDQVKQLIATTKPHYHLMGGLHSGETGPSEMLMELAYRLATETSPLITADPRQRHRLDHAGGRSRRPRPQRRLVLPEPRDAAIGSRPDGRGGAEPAAAPTRVAGQRRHAAAGARRPRRRARRAVLGQVRLPRQQPRHQPVAGVDARARRTGTSPRIPPIMHDLHESLALLYTYSGGPPQNPNLDPILFTELPFFSNFELAQMTKWGMPGVYTHGFMDGWSPGYLGSVAYNHNGMMRMYETQSGQRSRDAARRGCGADTAPAAGGRRGRAQTRPAASGGGAATQAAARQRRRRRRRHVDGAAAGRPSNAARRRTVAARRRRSPTGRGGGQTARVVSRHCRFRPARRELLAPQQHQLHADRRALGLQLTVDVPEPRDRELLPEDAELDRGGQERCRRIGYVIPVQRDMTRVAAARQHPARAAHRDRRRRTSEIKIERRHVPGRLVRHQARPAVRPARQEPARAAELSRSEPAHLRRQRLDDGAGDARGRQGDQGQGDPRRRRRRR